MQITPSAFTSTTASAGPVQLVLLDRDGVINFDSPDYIKQPAEWHPIPGALEAISRLQTLYTVAVCTNQSGVGRGMYSVRTLDRIHDKFITSLTALGGEPLDIHFCPHHPDAGCSCRKPLPGLLTTAMLRAGATADTTLYVGDSHKDLLAAQHAGCRFALVLSGNGEETLRTVNDATKHRPPQVYRDLAELADHLT